MSASTEKKNRKAARDAGTDKKELARIEAEKAAKTSKRKWTIGTIAVALLIVIALVLNAGFLFKHTTAVKVNGKSVTPAEASYYYKTLYNTYAQYSQYYGFDLTSMADVDTAMSDLERVKALNDYAAANGIALTAEEQQELEDSFASLETNVVLGGYKNLGTYLTYNYGTGVTEKLARQIAAEQLLADKAYDAKLDSFEYTEAELDEYYDSLEGAGDNYSYGYYYISADTVETTDEEGNTSNEVTEATMAEAELTANSVKAAYDAAATEDPSERFSMAVSLVVPEDSGSFSSNISGSSLNTAFSEWLMDGARKAGDITVAENASATGYYVVLFLDRNDNHYNTVAMRHILVQAAAEDDGTYSDEALAAAREEAEKIYAEWLAGDKTEDSFAALANEQSDDSGSNTAGGLYEDIYQGQMVPEIEEYLFGGRKAGDVEIIDVVSSNYAGTHIVYFVGEGDLYSRVIARDDLSSEAISAWEEELLAPYTFTKGWTYNLIGK